MSSANNVIGAMAAYLSQGTAAKNVSNVTSAKNSSQAAATSFDKILSKVSDSLIQRQTTDVSKQVNQAVDTAKTDRTADINTNNAVKNSENVRTDESAPQEVDRDIRDVVTTETQGTEADTELQEAITEDGKELLAQIADTFDISQEDIVNAMQVLGLMAADLLQPANLQMLVTELTGTEQAIDLITDSDIYTSLQDLMEGAESMKSELMNEFDLSEEGLQTAIEDNNRSFAGQLQQQTQFNPDETPEVTVNLRETQTQDNVDIKKTTAQQSEAFTDRAPIEEKPVEIVTENTKGGDNKGNNFQTGAESSNLFNQLVNNITQATDIDAASQVSYTDRAQMENIIRQITEKITVSQSAEETSMELSLHPASLGNVNILLTSGKDGIVAKFTAQNQIVKEAVEASMLQLQQKFEEQGIKVTSIEVTIASHGFEQNLEQGNDRQPGDTSAEKKVKPLRRINLSELEDEEVEEITSDAEKIAVQMMAANGNSVDFSA